MERSCENCKKNSAYMKNRTECVQCANGEIDAFEVLQEKKCLACKHSKIEPSFPYFPRKHGGYGCELQNYLEISKVSYCPLDKNLGR